MNDVLSAIRCGYPEWRAIMGDAALPAAIFMSAYALSAFLLFRTAAACGHFRDRLYWRACALICLVLLVNTPLDLHAWAWESGKCLARTQGWYDAREEVRGALMIGVAAISITLLLAVLAVSKRHPLTNGLLMLGMLMVLGVSALEAIGHHRLEILMSGRVGPMAGGDPPFQLVGIGMTIAAALLRSAGSERPPARKKAPSQSAPRPDDVRPRLR